ncbi:MAG: hypothetical protein H6911_04905 [Rickettsiaceae bacterium]|nr:hypothetical protein [Rickettsiaceae bacterium]
MKKNTLFIVNIFLIFSLFGCNSKPSAKSESQVNTPNQEQVSITVANTDSSIPENQKLFDYSLSYQEMSEIKKLKWRLQQQNQALASKRTQESYLPQNKNLTNKEKIKIEKEDRRNTLLKTIPPAKRPLYTGRDFNTTFPQNY